MTRVKGGPVAKTRRRKVLKLAKGYFGSKHRLYKTAQEQIFHSGAYAYRDRKQNKRNFRKLWIVRINAACELHDMSYSRFINGLNKAGIVINRKMLSEIAIDNPKAFTDLVNLSKDGLAGKIKKAEVVETVAVKEPKAVKEAVAVKTTVKKEPKAVKEVVAVKVTVKKEPKAVKEVIAVKATVKKAPKTVKSTVAVTEKIKKAPKVVKEEKPTSKKEDLSTKTLVELKELAKKQEIKGYSTMKKADLIKALS